MVRWLLVIALFCACGGKDTTSGDVLSQEAMEHLMLEIHLAEALVTSDPQEGIEPKLRQQILMDSLLAEKQISRETFLESYAFYLARPEIMDSIYVHIIDSLNHALTRAQAIESERQNR